MAGAALRLVHVEREGREALRGAVSAEAVEDPGEALHRHGCVGVVSPKLRQQGVERRPVQLLRLLQAALVVQGARKALHDAGGLGAGAPPRSAVRRVPRQRHRLPEEPLGLLVPPCVLEHARRRHGHRLALRALKAPRHPGHRHTEGALQRRIEGHEPDLFVDLRQDALRYPWILRLGLVDVNVEEHVREALGIAGVEQVREQLQLPEPRVGRVPRRHGGVVLEEQPGARGPLAALVDDDEQLLDVRVADERSELPDLLLGVELVVVEGEQVDAQDGVLRAEEPRPDAGDRVVKRLVPGEREVAPCLAGLHAGQLAVGALEGLRVRADDLVAHLAAALLPEAHRRDARLIKVEEPPHRDAAVDELGLQRPNRRHAPAGCLC
mmetsp:Transcript_8580/g.20616  ORF Transcript_8580/g.20616 Transcript_8580/m.20616 type:complete len:381 (+) Transcript_8580:740-1882(+)